MIDEKNENMRSNRHAIAWSEREPPSDAFVAVYFDDRPTPLFCRMKRNGFFRTPQQMSADGEGWVSFDSAELKNAYWYPIPEPPNFKWLKKEREIEAMRGNVEGTRRNLEHYESELKKLIGGESK